jgi:hypothetical protein
MENIKVRACHKKLFISFKFIHNDAKNDTSSTVFAFNTMNPINAPHTIKVIRAIIHRKVKILLKGTFLFFSSSTTSFVKVVLINNFDQSKEGTTFVIIL